MTRQKKELEKRIRELEEQMIVDLQMGFGIVPKGGFEPYYAEIDALNDKLAELRGYANRVEMFYDWRHDPIYRATVRR